MILFEEMVTQKELLEMSGVTRQTLHRDIQTGKITCIKINGKENRFIKEDAIEYAKDKKERGRSEEWKKKSWKSSVKEN